MTTLIATDSSATAKEIVGQQLNSEQKMIDKYTKRWSGEIGKSFKGVLASAKILYEAKVEFTTYLLGENTYNKWLKDIRINQSAASMYRLIHSSDLIRSGNWDDQLSADYTKLYQLARIEKEYRNRNDPAKAKSLFLDALEYMNTVKVDPVIAKEKDENGHAMKDCYPSYAELQSFVNDLLEKPKKAPKAPASPSVPPDQERKDQVTGQAVSAMNENKSPLGEDPSPDLLEFAEGHTPEENVEGHIEDEGSEFADDDNDVQFEEFNRKFDALRLQIEIKRVLNQHGLTHVKVTIAPKPTEMSA